ncbi:hypothetical protein MMC19_007792 [Ptychographa xylographoides]|nr:hypothetical protein [Ptychographa xylographoides]
MIERIRSNDAGAFHAVVSADPVPDLSPDYSTVEDDSLEDVALALDEQEEAEAEAVRKTAEDQQDAMRAEQARQQHEEEENAEINAESRAQGR